LDSIVLFNKIFSDFISGTFAGKWDAMSQKYEDASDSLSDLIERLMLISDKFDECNMTVENAENMNKVTQDNVAAITDALDIVKTKLNQV